LIFDFPIDGIIGVDGGTDKAVPFKNKSKKSVPVRAMRSVTQYNGLVVLP
jgi:hypothetical protein